MTENYHIAKKGFLVTKLADAVAEVHAKVKTETDRIAKDPTRAAWGADLFIHSAAWEVLTRLHHIVADHPSKDTWSLDDFQQIAREKVLDAASSLHCRSTSPTSNLYDDHVTKAWADIMRSSWGCRWFVEALRCDPDWIAAQDAEYQKSKAERDRKVAQAEGINAHIKKCRRLVRKAEREGATVSDEVRAAAAKEYVTVNVR